MTWTGKTKNSGNTPSYKSRIATRIERGYILTPDNQDVLVGSDEDLVLIYQDESSLWNNSKLKSVLTIYSAKTKTPII
jgi:hypothetical protein